MALSVAIVDDNPIVLRTLEELLKKENDLELVGKAGNGEDAIRMIQRTSPDVVLLDLIMPKIDGIAVVERVRKESRNKKIPAFIVLSSAGGEEIAEEAFRVGVNYYLMKPFDRQTLLNRIHRIGAHAASPMRELNAHTEPKPAVDRVSYMAEHLETDVTKLLQEVGTPAHIKGYKFLRDAIMLSVQNPEMMSSVTKILYPEIAKKNKTTASRVERAIRHAIEVAWGRGKVETIEEIFGYTINAGKGKPTNSEFIALISDKITLDYKKRTS